MIPKRLSQSSDYERPKKTITESIQTKKDIEEQLKNYEEVSQDDLNFLNKNTHLRYISYDKKNKKEIFRFGGFLMKVDKEYLILSGKDNLTFSVQRYTRNDKKNIIHTTRFFKKIKESEYLKSQLDETINQSNDIIEKQNYIIDKQKKELIELKKMLKKK